MLKILLVSGALALSAVACSSDGGSAADGDTATTTATSVAPDGSEGDAGDPSPPQLPGDFTWTGRYLVPDLDVEVPFTWHGRDGDFQMIAGGEDEPIHFTNLVHDGELYTLTYEWPDVPRNPCSHVGPFTVADLNQGLAEAAFVGRETLHGEPDREVNHYRATSVWDLPEELVPAADGVPQLRLPLTSGDVYVDVDDPHTFWKVLHFGVQNLYDPNLDEWIVIDEAEPVAGEVELPAECAAARTAAD